TLLTVGLASPLLFFLPFDFDPNHMRSPDVPSVATYLELRRDPQAGANAIDAVLPNLSAANATAGRLLRLPQVAPARTLSSLVPSEQDPKLKLIHDAATTIDASLNPDGVEPAPSDQETIDALTGTADSLTKAAGVQPGSGADAARRLAGLLSRLATSQAA